jgi:hypothetical protein
MMFGLKQRFRFGLRTLFVCMLIACLAGVGLREWRRRRNEAWELRLSKDAMKNAWLRNDREQLVPAEPRRRK